MPVYPNYDMILQPIADKARLINARLVYDTSTTPESLTRWYEDGYGICVPVDMDGNIYTDTDCTNALFASAIPPRPSSGAYTYFMLVPDKNFIYGVWLGKTTNDFDTPVLVAINKAIDAILIYNLSNNNVTINHNTARWPNYETNGTYDSTTTPPTITLGPGQYALLYNTTKPTVDPNTPWGFTDYDPIVATTKPSNYIAIYDGSTYKYVQASVKINRIISLVVNAILEEVNGANMSIGPAGLYFRLQIRNSNNADFIAVYGAPNPAPKMPTNLRLYNIYDYDPPTGYTWAGGFYPTSVVYIESGLGPTLVVRGVKHTTKPYNPRIVMAYGILYKIVDSVTIWGKLLLAHRMIVDATAYGCVNDVPTPGFQIGNYTDPATFEYYDGNTWGTPNKGTGDLVCQSGYAVGAEIYDMIDNSVRYRMRLIMRRRNVYNNLNPTVGALDWGTTPPMGWNAVFVDYGGGTVPAGSYVLEIADFVITTDGSEPQLLLDTVVDDQVFPYLIGYPYSIDVQVSTTATDVTLTVTTDAPDGKTVYVVNKSTGEIVATGTVSGGQATITFPRPSQDTQYRVYIEGDDLEVVSS